MIGLLSNNLHLSQNDEQIQKSVAWEYYGISFQNFHRDACTSPRGTSTPPGTPRGTASCAGPATYLYDIIIMMIIIIIIITIIIIIIMIMIIMIIIYQHRPETAKYQFFSVQNILQR